MTIHIFGGGTVQHVRNHMALCAPAYGQTARKLHADVGHDLARLHLTRMADFQSSMETNEDVETRLHEVLADQSTRVVVFNVALCDYAGQIGDIPSGKYAKRLSSREGTQAMTLAPTPKLLQQVKAIRPDVYLVGFKTTAGAEQREQHRLALRQMTETGADLVFANDTVTRHNMLVEPHGFYAGGRDAMLVELVGQLRRQAC
jgi:phosphopantothenoylcysteine synthetase/decarboxylase